MQMVDYHNACQPAKLGYREYLKKKKNRNANKSAPIYKVEVSDDNIMMEWDAHFSPGQN